MERQFKYFSIVTSALLMVLSIVFYLQRDIMYDSSFYFFDMLETKSFCIQHYRYPAVLSQLLPLLFIKTALPLKWIAVAYSLNLALIAVVLALLSGYWLKNWKAAAAIVLSPFLFNSEMFFWMVAESQYLPLYWLFIYAFIDYCIGKSLHPVRLLLLLLFLFLGFTIHPLSVLMALKTYASGRGIKGGNSWQPVGQITDALDEAFYRSFATIQPTGKRWLLALDVSGSMNNGEIAGMPGITPRVGSAAMAMITARTEPNHHIVAFSHAPRANITFSNFQKQGPHNLLVPVNITPRQRLDDVMRQVDGIPMGATDCALPMVYALENKIPVDVFVIYTDSETWAGTIHPTQALRQYREQMGIPAKLIVVAMVSNGFSIADPNDAGMMDVVGFDAAAPAVMADFSR